MSDKFDQVYKKYLPEALPVLAALGAAARVAAPAIGRGLASAGRGLASAGKSVIKKSGGASSGFAVGSSLGGGGGSGGGQAGGGTSSSGGGLSAPVTTTQSDANIDKLAGELTNVSDSNKVKQILAANLK